MPSKTISFSINMLFLVPLELRGGIYVRLNEIAQMVQNVNGQHAVLMSKIEQIANKEKRNHEVHTIMIESMYKMRNDN